MLKVNKYLISLIFFSSSVFAQVDASSLATCGINFMVHSMWADKANDPELSKNLMRAAELTMSYGNKKYGKDLFGKAIDRNKKFVNHDDVKAVISMTINKCGPLVQEIQKIN